MKSIAMIPARLGSQRLKQKNLLKINGDSLVKLCAKKCLDADVFEKVYINSESDLILKEAPSGCLTYKRKEGLANNVATSDNFILDFLQNIKCDYLFQIHSIAPLVTKEQVKEFALRFIESEKQVGLCCEKIVLETIDHDEQPINFTFQEKTNSQDLKSPRMINWAMTAWKVDAYLIKQRCISFGENRFFYEIPRTSGIVVKTKEDYEVCKRIMEKKC